MTDDQTLHVGDAPPLPQVRATRNAPKGSCDTHLHFIAADPEFPLWHGRVEDPSPGDFEAWMVLLEDHLAALGMDRVVFVHSILFGGDNAITLAATERLGPERARAICLVSDGADDKLLDDLVGRGAVGVRLNYVHGGLLSWTGAQELAPRLAERNMHLQMLVNAADNMAEIAEGVRLLPVPVVFDHIGWPDLSAGVRDPGFSRLVQLVSEGHAYVKLSGLYRFCPAPYDQADEAIAALIRANVDRCLWGSDWPHIMRAGAPMPTGGPILDALLRVATEAEAQKILVDNPTHLYRF